MGKGGGGEGCGQAELLRSGKCLDVRLREVLEGNKMDTVIEYNRKRWRRNRKQVEKGEEKKKRETKKTKKKKRRRRRKRRI